MQIKVIQPSVERKQERKKVCAYVRVSTDSAEQEDSYDNQMRYYKDKIESNPDWEFVGIYSDLGISGYKEKRPGFLNMIKDARNGGIDLILVKSVSRFARNTETVLKYSRELKRIGVGIYFELQDVNTISGEGELLLTILAAFAQAESESNSGNVSMSIRRKFEKGELNFPISKIYGYTADVDGNPIIDEEKAKVVRLIFDLAEKGIWVTKISEYLNKQHIPGIRQIHLFLHERGNTGNDNSTIKDGGNTSQNRGGDRVDKRIKHAEEGQQDGKDAGDECSSSIIDFRHGDNAGILGIGRVCKAAQQTGNRSSDAVADQTAVQTGINDEVALTGCAHSGGHAYGVDHTGEGNNHKCDHRICCHVEVKFRAAGQEGER